MRPAHWILLPLLVFGQPLGAQEHSGNVDSAALARADAETERNSSAGEQARDTARTRSPLPSGSLQTNRNTAIAGPSTTDTATRAATGSAAEASSASPRRTESTETPSSAPRREYSTTPPAPTSAPAPSPAQSAGPAPTQVTEPPTGNSQSQTPAKKIPSPVRRNNAGHLLDQPPPSPPALHGNPGGDLPPLRQLLVQASDLQTAERQRRQLGGLGLRIASRRVLSHLGLVISVFKFPQGADPQALLESVESLLGQPAELNRRYRLLAAGKRSYAQAMVGSGAPSRCRQSPLLAMLDSRVNPDSNGLDDGRVQLEDVAVAQSKPHDHGTGIASLLVSNHGQFPGLLPRARLLAVNVFAEDDRGEQETRTDWLLAGLDRVAAANPIALNLSFGGGYSALLEGAFAQLSQRMLLVAAAGNDGGEEVVYPAAYTGVYAVGALDARGRPARQSNRGPHVQLLAPGEDIWTADGKGGGVYASGTSFATPFATAALALAKINELDPARYIAGLESGRVDFRALCAVE